MATKLAIPGERDRWRRVDSRHAGVDVARATRRRTPSASSRRRSPQVSSWPIASARRATLLGPARSPATSRAPGALPGRLTRHSRAYVLLQVGRSYFGFGAIIALARAASSRSGAPSGWTRCCDRCAQRRSGADRAEAQRVSVIGPGPEFAKHWTEQRGPAFAHPRRRDLPRARPARNRMGGIRRARAPGGVRRDRRATGAADRRRPSRRSAPACRATLSSARPSRPPTRARAGRPGGQRRIDPDRHARIIRAQRLELARTGSSVELENSTDELPRDSSGFAKHTVPIGPDFSRQR